MKNKTRRIAAAVLAFCITAGTMPAENCRTVFPAAYAAEEKGTQVEKDGMMYNEFADHIELIYCKPDGDTLNIPDTIDGKPVTAIAEYAFATDAYKKVGYPDLPETVRKVYIPEGVEVINIGAFGGDLTKAGISEVYLPSTLKTVRISAFSRNTHLNVYGLPETAEVENLAFDNTQYNYDKRANFIVKDGMYYWDYADHISLRYCEPDGDTLNIPDTIDGKPVTEICEGAFYADYPYDFGVPELSVAVKKVYIPEGVEVIGDHAFYCSSDGYEGICEVHLPSTLKKVGACAFAYNEKLTVYGLKENVELAENAFLSTHYDAVLRYNFIERDGMIYYEYADHISLVYCEPDGDTLNIPDTIDGKPVTEISFNAFSDKAASAYDEDIPELPAGVKKVYIPEGVEYIDDFAFNADSRWEKGEGLYEVYLPSTLKEVGECAFSYNFHLNVYGLPETAKLGFDAFDETLFDPENRINFIISDELAYIDFPDHIALVHCEPDGDTLYIPDTLNGKPVTEIATDSRFYDITEGRYWVDCPGFKDSAIKKVYVPEGVEVIGGSVFADMPESDGNLEEVYLPSTLKKVGDFAFIDQKKLNVYGLPETAELGRDAFGHTHYDAERRANLVIRDDIIYVDHPDHASIVYFAPEGDTLTFPDMVDGKPVTEICGESVDKGEWYVNGLEVPDYSDTLKKVYIPEGVEVIGDHVLSEVSENFGELYLPSTLKKVGQYAFFDNSSLNVYGLPETAEIGTDAFRNTHFDAERRANLVVRDEIIYVDHPDHASIVYCAPEGDTLTFPDMVDGKPVTEICGESVDKGTWDVDGLKIPDYSDTLKKVYVPEGVEVIGDHVLSEVSENFGELYLPSTLKKVGQYAFFDNSSLNVYGLPETAEIGRDAFKRTRYDAETHSNYIDKDGMVYREYPDHVELFYCAPDGDTLVFPDMVDGKPVTIIDTEAILDLINYGIEYREILDGVKKVYIPEDVELVAGFVNYDGREGLSEVHFPSTLKTVYEHAFEGNKNLKIFGLPETAEIGIDAFNGTPYEGKFSTAPTANIAYGDANLDGKVTLADSLAILQFIANEDKYPLSAQAQKNADCYNPGDGITGNDAVAVMRYDTKVVSKLPIIEK